MDCSNSTSIDINNNHKEYSEERRLKALHDGCCLIEEIMKEYETWIKKNRRDASSYICNKSKHYAMYVFHKFYSHNELEKYNYVDVAITCCYFISKIQDSVLTKVNKVKDFLGFTKEAWMKIRNRSLDDLAYIIPRLECILYHGIGFDLRLDIPHKYVVECFRVSINMKPNEADALITNGSKPSDCVRYFLRFCMLSQLCVDERFDGRSLAAAAVDYALTTTHLTSHKNYNPNWLEQMNRMPNAVGNKVLSIPFIKEIQKERKLISPKINACIENIKHSSPIPHEEERYSEKRIIQHTEENSKRARMSSPLVESIGQRQPTSHSPPPIQLPSTQPTRLPSTQPTLSHASTEPTPLISFESTSNEPAPLLSTQTSTQSLPVIMIPSTESVDSPAPLFISQSADQSQDVPLFPF